MGGSKDHVDIEDDSSGDRNGKDSGRDNGDNWDAGGWVWGASGTTSTSRTTVTATGTARTTVRMMGMTWTPWDGCWELQGPR